MSYRTINVDDKEYKWMVGISNIEIKGEGFKLLIPLIHEDDLPPYYRVPHPITPKFIADEIRRNLGS